MHLRIAEPIVVESLQFLLVSESECSLSGTLSSDTAQRALAELLDTLHVRVEASRVSAFQVDVRRLEFVNSSAIRLFVNWISRAQSTDYELTFVIDRSVTWHRLTFSTLRSLAPETVSIVDGGNAANLRQEESHQ